MSETEVAIVQNLTPKDLARLDQLESVIDSGQKAFVEVGQALMAIRDGRLYRTTHETFEAYCKERWGMVRRHAYRLLDAASVVECVQLDTKPANEAQARPLTKLRAADNSLDPDAIREAWQEAVDSAGDKPVKAKHVQAVVRRRLPQDDGKKQWRPKKPRPLPGGCSPEELKIVDDLQQRIFTISQIIAEQGGNWTPENRIRLASMLEDAAQTLRKGTD